MSASKLYGQFKDVDGQDWDVETTEGGRVYDLVVGSNRNPKMRVVLNIGHLQELARARGYHQQQKYNLAISWAGAYGERFLPLFLTLMELSRADYEQFHNVELERTRLRQEREEQERKERRKRIKKNNMLNRVMNACSYNFMDEYPVGTWDLLCGEPVGYPMLADLIDEGGHGGTANIIRAMCQLGTATRLNVWNALSLGLFIEEKSTPWTTKNGRVIPWEQLSDEHLFNIAKMLFTKTHDERTERSPIAVRSIMFRKFPALKIEFKIRNLEERWQEYEQAQNWVQEHNDNRRQRDMYARYNREPGVHMVFDETISHNSDDMRQNRESGILLYGYQRLGAIEQMPRDVTAVQIPEEHQGWTEMTNRTLGEPFHPDDGTEQ